MDQKQYFLQMINFNRAAFDGSFSALGTLQEQAERMAGTVIDQATWLPEPGRQAINEWANACKKGREDFKKMVDDSFQKVEAYFKDLK